MTAATLDAPLEIHRARIDGPGAWTPASVGGKEGFVHTLTPRQLAAVDGLLAAVGYQTTTSMKVSDPLSDTAVAAGMQQGDEFVKIGEASATGDDGSTCCHVAPVCAANQMGSSLELPHDWNVVFPVCAPSVRVSVIGTDTVAMPAPSRT